MGATPPIGLYRWSKKNAGPSMEVVRYPPGATPLFVIDVQVDAVTGLVRGRLGGVSTFSAPNSHRARPRHDKKRFRAGSCKRERVFPIATAKIYM
jgi:hypothetical protein